ncbi:hypothetical protein EQM14_13220 [Caproiciproducens sp. NJN-50]|uniref:hypothetical protein n=1 Tax=Acutalibacteraceae TaxID=3082771 RepID=UPI000FFE190B|nr:MULTISPECIES: hypothetical protein [Acutalibacteraceae]QAT50643.1 hypothetical protein EQM14_13220 [Caproiciproducens sp. NJN-50]
MKKTGWLLIIVLVVIICGGVLLFTNGKLPVGSPSSSGTGSESSSAVPSSAVSSAVPSSASSGSVSSLTDDQIKEKIESAVPLDWKKYTLKEEKDKPVALNGVTYRTYSAWDEDYTEGPLLLYSPKDGNVYTYTYNDKAPTPASEDPAFDKTEHTVVGVVKDAAMMSVLIHTTDGHDLTVRRLGVTLVNLDNGFKVGQNVKVTYTGVYKDDDAQRMFVTKIEGVQ